PLAQRLTLFIDAHPLHMRGLHVCLSFDGGNISSETLRSRHRLPHPTLHSLLRFGILGMLWRKSGANFEPQIYT
ncbi:hypothetical protein HDZ31DRAFT_15350, partial [Schizophyllum fasciatum]